MNLRHKPKPKDKKNPNARFHGVTAFMTAVGNKTNLYFERVYDPVANVGAPNPQSTLKF